MENTFIILPMMQAVSVIHAQLSKLYHPLCNETLMSGLRLIFGDIKGRQ
jgi:hypothetical protein